MRLLCAAAISLALGLFVAYADDKKPEARPEGTRREARGASRRSSTTEFADLEKRLNKAEDAGRRSRAPVRDARTRRHHRREGAGDRQGRPEGRHRLRGRGVRRAIGGEGRRRRQGRREARRAHRRAPRRTARRSRTSCSRRDGARRRRRQVAQGRRRERAGQGDEGRSRSSCAATRSPRPSTTRRTRRSCPRWSPRRPT